MTSAPRLERDVSLFFPVDISRLIIGYVSLGECFLAGYIGRRDVDPPITFDTIYMPPADLATVFKGDAPICVGHIGIWYDTTKSITRMLDGEYEHSRTYDYKLHASMIEALK